MFQWSSRNFKVTRCVKRREEEEREDEDGKVLLKTTAENLPGTSHKAGEVELKGKL